jgi:hypothetical protein
MALGMALMGKHIMGMALIDIHLMGIYFMGMHLKSMHLMRFWEILGSGPFCQFTPPYDGNGSHNGTACNELSRHSKAARAQLDLIQSEYAALDRIISQGDDSNNSDNSNLESQEGVEDALTRPSQREDIAWPDSRVQAHSITVGHHVTHGPT